jgi:hypothetical protein
VTDCDTYDDQPAKLSAVPLEGEQPPAVRLTATRHSACVSAPVTTEPGVRDVVATFDYQSSSATGARVALVDTVTGRVVANRRLPASTFWSTQQVRWLLPPPPSGREESLRLTLYAEGPRLGEPASLVTTAYRSVRLTTATPFAFAVLPLAKGTSAGTPGIDVRGLDGRFVAVTADRDVIITFQQAFATGWSLDGLPQGATAEHFEVNGWANGWRVHGLDGRSAVLHTTYRGEGLVAFAVWSVLVVWFVTLLCTDWPRWFRRRTRSSGSDSNETPSIAQ